MPLPLEATKVLGRYALHGRLASGGMAAVHLGRLVGPAGFARTVAIKRLHAHLAQDPDFVSMFVDEARLVARINHPNVVPTIDVVASEGELFIVMEYVRGETLSRLLRLERIGVETVATIMAGVLHGLHAAHEAKSERGDPLEIVHRDVSPQNIMVGADGVPRILDFGVAKAFGRLQTTRDGSVKGKLSYMAPEQIHGIVSRRTDVYAAAVTLWEALAGRRLFDGAVEGQILHDVAVGCSQPPSVYGPDVPAWLDAVTMRGLALDPDDRFSTAHEMARAIEDAMPLQPASKIAEWVRRVAAEKLYEREARIAEIESNTPQGSPTIAAFSSRNSDRGTPVGQRVVSHRDAVGRIASEDLTTPMSSGSLSIVSRPKLGSRNSLLTGLFAGTGVVALAGVVAWLAHGSTQRKTDDQVGRSTAGATASDNVTIDGSPSIASPATNDAPPPSASAGVSQAPASATGRAPVAPLPRVRSRATTTPASHCDPPYFFDERNVRVFKKECL